MVVVEYLISMIVYVKLREISWKSNDIGASHSKKIFWHLIYLNVAKGGGGDDCKEFILQSFIQLIQNILHFALASQFYYSQQLFRSDNHQGTQKMPFNWWFCFVIFPQSKKRNITFHDTFGSLLIKEIITKTTNNTQPLSCVLFEFVELLNHLCIENVYKRLMVTRD